MPEGTYISFDTVGHTVEDPEFVVWLEGSDVKYGSSYISTTIEEIVDYLLHRDENITIGELSTYYEENGRPNVRADVDGRGEQLFIWSDEEEDYVKSTDDPEYAIVIEVDDAIAYLDHAIVTSHGGFDDMVQVWIHPGAEAHVWATKTGNVVVDTNTKRIEFEEAEILEINTRFGEDDE